VRSEPRTKLGGAICATALTSEREDALTVLATLLRDDLEACNRAILSHMDSAVPMIPQLAAHVVAAGGKRIRPLLTLGTARMCGYPGPTGSTRHVQIAACVELIHTATLLHDDVVDESALRRGLASANAVFGNKASVLVGDFLFARAFQIMVDDGSPRVLAILAEAAATMAQGEVLQLTTQNDLATSDALYLDVIEGKTAALFAASCQVGAVIAGRDDAAAALASFGSNLGMAFQLVDDALDYTANQVVLGKTVGDDFREGKVTLPVLIAYRRGDATEKLFWERTIGQAAQADGDLEQALRLMRQRNSIGATLSYARRYAERSRSALAAFPDTKLRRTLGEVADYTIARSR
jgi:octaprenyl-diphosphate synthase